MPCGFLITYFIMNIVSVNCFTLWTFSFTYVYFKYIYMNNEPWWWVTFNILHSTRWKQMVSHISFSTYIFYYNVFFLNLWGTNEHCLGHIIFKKRLHTGRRSWPYEQCSSPWYTEDQLPWVVLPMGHFGNHWVIGSIPVGLRYWDQ